MGNIESGKFQYGADYILVSFRVIEPKLFILIISSFKYKLIQTNLRNLKLKYCHSSWWRFFSFPAAETIRLALTTYRSDDAACHLRYLNWKASARPLGLIVCMEN